MKNDLIIWMQTIDLKKHSGGAEKFIANIARKLIIADYKPIIIAANDKLTIPYIEKYLHENVQLKIIRLPRPNIWILGSFIYVLLSIIIINIYYNKIKVVHFNSINHRAALISFFSRIFKKRVILRSNGGDSWFINDKLSKNNTFTRFHISMLNLSNKIIVQSSEGFKLLKNIGIKSNIIEKIPNGVSINLYNDKRHACLSDIIPELKITNDTKIISCLNGLNRYKDVDVIIKSFSQLNKVYINTHLLIIGDGILRNSLHKLSQKLKLNKKITFVGNVDNPADYLNISDIFILASNKENFSNALLEAMACALPIVVSDVGGNKEIIQHKNNGLKFRVGSVSGLEKNLKFLIENEKISNDLGLRARASVIENYSLEEIFKKYEKLYYKDVFKHQAL